MVKGLCVLVLPYLVIGLDPENKSAHYKDGLISRRLSFKTVRSSNQHFSLVIPKLPLSESRSI